MKKYIKGVTWLLLWITIFYPRLGESTTLPDGIEDITSTNNYACFGCNGMWQPTCEHKPDTVIAVQMIKIGAKPVDLNCSDVVISYEEEDCKNVTCCQPNITQDCIQDYNYAMSGIDYRYHRNCSGRPECSEPIEIVYDFSSCDSTYMAYTNYLYIEYGCVEESKMINMCQNETHSDSKTLYLHTPQYPNSMDMSMTSDCSCSVSSDNDVILNAYLIDVQLANQTLNIDSLDNGTFNSFSYNRNSATLFNITQLDIGHDANITLENLSETHAGTKVWIGIKAKTGEPFKVTCWGPSAVNNTSADSAASSTPNAPSNLILIICIAAGVSLLLLIIICCCLYRCFKKKPTQRKKHPDQKDTKETGSKSADCEHQRKNSTFGKHRIPKNSVAPTPFIKVHGGLTHLPPIAPNTPVVTSLPTKSPAQLQLFEVSQQSEIDDRTEKKHKKKHRKKGKKHKKHKHKHRTEQEAVDVDTEKTVDIAGVNTNMDSVNVDKNTDKIGTNTDMSNSDANKDMSNDSAHSELDNDNANNNTDHVYANTDMDNTGANTDMDTAGANIDMDTAGANTDMNNAGANTDIHDASANIDIDNAGVNTDMDYTGANTVIDNVSANIDIDNVGANTYMDNDGANPGIYNAGANTDMDNAGVSTDNAEGINDFDRLNSDMGNYSDNINNACVDKDNADAKNSATEA